MAQLRNGGTANRDEITIATRNDMKPKQLSFLPKPRKEYGGDTRGKRKDARPFNPKLAMHITLRSSRARGKWSMLRHKWEIHELLMNLSDRYKIRVYRYANVGNHLHLLVQARNHQNFKNFLRQFAGTVAVLVTGAIKGRPQKFWDFLAHSKLVEWGRHFRNTARYILLNMMEPSGLRDHTLLAKLERDGVVYLAPEHGD